MAKCGLDSHETVTYLYTPRLIPCELKYLFQGIVWVDRAGAKPVLALASLHGPGMGRLISVSVFLIASTLDLNKTLFQMICVLLLIELQYNL